MKAYITQYVKNLVVGEYQMKFNLSIVAIAIAVVLVLATATPSFAANGSPPDAGCQQNWQMMSVEEFAEFLVEEFNAPSYELALESAENTYSFCDHNGDGYACIIIRNLPNDNSGSEKWWLAQDNHPFGGK